MTRFVTLTVNEFEFVTDFSGQLLEGGLPAEFLAVCWLAMAIFPS